MSNLERQYLPGRGGTFHARTHPKLRVLWETPGNFTWRRWQVSICLPLSFPCKNRPPPPPSVFGLWASSGEQMYPSAFLASSTVPNTCSLNEWMAPYMDKMGNHLGIWNRVSMGWGIWEGCKYKNDFCAFQLGALNPHWCCFCPRWDHLLTPLSWSLSFSSFIAFITRGLLSTSVS